MFGLQTKKRNRKISKKINKRKTAMQQLARHRHVQAVFIAFSVLLVITGIVAVQRVQNYQSEATSSCKSRCITKYNTCVQDQSERPQGVRDYATCTVRKNNCDATCESPSAAVGWGTTGDLPQVPRRLGAAARFAAAAAQYASYLGRTGSSDTPAARAAFTRSTGSAPPPPICSGRCMNEATQTCTGWTNPIGCSGGTTCCPAGATVAAKPACTRDGGMCYSPSGKDCGRTSTKSCGSTSLKCCAKGATLSRKPQCTPIKTAPTVTYIGRTRVAADANRITVASGEADIKWSVAKGQLGGIVVIDDLSSTGGVPSCNTLKNGDSCRVPEDKGRSNKLTYSFQSGKSYNMRIATINCGTASNLSKRLKIVVGNSTASESGRITAPNFSTLTVPTATPTPQ